MDWIEKILWIALISGCLLFVGVVTNAHADTFKTLGVRHDDRPNVCIFEANPDDLSRWKWAEIEAVTKTSIKAWETALENKYPYGDWFIYIYDTVPYEEHKDKTPDDYRECNVLITFEKENNTDRKDAMGTTAIDFSKSYHKFMYIIVYLESYSGNTIKLDLGDLKTNSTETDGTRHFFFKIEKNPLPIQAIKNIVLHEFGHALGVSHYNTTEAFLPEERDTDRSIMSPQLNPYETKLDYNLRDVDIEMIKMLYGGDGWRGYDPIYIPKYCTFTNGTITGCD